MGFSRLAAANLCLLAVLVPTQALAQEAKAEGQANLSAAGSTTAPAFFDNYSIRLGLEAAGPLLFRDVPDGRVEQTTIFQYGGRLGFLFGNELKNPHRGGIGMSYLFTGKSDSRSLTFIPIYLLYETGHPLVLQAALGVNATAGTAGFKGHYAGMHTGLVLRYSFLREDSGPITVSPGIAARSNVVFGDMQYSSVFVGAQLEISYNTNN